MICEGQATRGYLSRDVIIAWISSRLTQLVMMTKIDFTNIHITSLGETDTVYSYFCRGMMVACSSIQTLSPKSILVNSNGTVCPQPIHNPYHPLGIPPAVLLQVAHHLIPVYRIGFLSFGICNLVIRACFGFLI